MHIGPFIKLHRIDKNMTQEDLAAGIVSISYLSKIENQRTDASTEVIEMLCKRLGVEGNEVNEGTLRESCRSWYGMLYEGNDRKEITEVYEMIKQQIQFALTEGALMFEIHVIRYYLVMGNHKKAHQQIRKLTEIESSFDPIHKYFWYKFKGNYHSIYHQVTAAMELYKMAEKTAKLLTLSKDQQADLHYTISVTHSKLRNTLETIEYAEQALDIYRETYHFVRCAQCHLLLGISYRRIRLYDKAIENHNLAKQLGKMNDNRQVIQLANQNLGYLYATNGDVTEAIRHYEEVLNDSKVDLNARLPAIASLIKEYYSIEEIKKTYEMVEQGLAILAQVKNKKAYTLYKYIIYTYKHVMDGETKAFEDLVIHEFLPHLHYNKDYVNIVVYTTMLANHYEKLHTYKDAVFYHKQAIEAYKQLTNM